MARIHQFTAGFTQGDAISNEAVALRQLFRSWGHESEIFSDGRRIRPDLRKEAGDAATYAASCRPDDIVMLHLSIGSDVNRVFAALPCKKAITYHNVTPPHYFATLNPQTAGHLARGLEQVKELAGVATAVRAVSEFNAAELRALGYPDVSVVPILLDFDNLRAKPDGRILKSRDDETIVLFVGRCAPNKRIEDLLNAFHYFQANIEPNSRLVHVGSFTGVEPYYHMLLGHARKLGIDDRVIFAGAVPQAELNAWYRVADVFLCMSEHEGFCIPVIESMFHGLPVLAAADGAVPETMAGAGIVFSERDFPSVAELMGRVVRDETLREAIVAGQRRRIEAYVGRDLGAEMKAFVGPLLGSG